MSSLNTVLNKLTGKEYGKFTFTYDKANKQWWCHNVLTHQFEIGNTAEAAALKLLEKS